MLEDQFKKPRILGTQHKWKVKSRASPHEGIYIYEAMTPVTMNMNSESRDLLRGTSQCRDKKIKIKWRQEAGGGRANEGRKHSRIQDTERKQVVWMPLGQQDILRVSLLS